MRGQFLCTGTQHNQRFEIDTLWVLYASHFHSMGYGHDCTSANLFRHTKCK